MWQNVTRLAGNPKVLGIVGRLGNIIRNPAFMPGAGGVIGGVKGGMDDGFAGALRGAAAGATTGGAMRWGLGKIPPGMLPAGQARILGTAVPLVGGITAGMTAVPSANAISEGAGNTANTVGGVTALNMQNQPNVTGGYLGTGGPVPPIGGAHGGMIQGPDGNWYQQVDPTGYRQGGRFGSGLDTMQDISNNNRWFESRFPQREMIMKADFERELAAKQLKENIEMARNITQGYAASSRNIAEDANRNMGTILANKNTFF